MAREKEGRGRSAALLLVGLILVAAGIWMASARWETAGGDLPGAGQPVLIQAQATQRQTLVYKRCNHSVTRTVDVPDGWAGLSRQQLEEQLDMAWRITDFSPTRIVMQRNLMLFCPQHWVLMPDELGRVCLWVNRYGEGMERVYETEWMLSDMPEAEREAVRIGLGFDLLEEAEGYLEGLDS